MKKQFFLSLSSFILILFVMQITTRPAFAASLSHVSDRISTSRPSAASPLSANAASGASQVSIFNNSSRYLASDSAQILRGVGTYAVPSVTIASQSSALTSVYFAGTLSGAAGAGSDVLIVPITATHTISFTIPTSIPASGNIVLTFPGSANTSASPSATTFAFNGLTSGNAAANISYKLDGSATCTFTVAAPAITCATSAIVAANTTITFIIGCSDSSSNETTCTSSGSAPRLINPTKNSSTAGSADTWQINVKTQDASSIDLDQSNIKIGTVEAVQVLANVDPSLSVTIAGIANGANFQTSAGTCPSEQTNSGIDATATVVNLGSLGSGVINKAGQTITVSTNATNGYAITATSSGTFLNPAVGFWIYGANNDTALTANDTPAPAVFPASGNPAFGISPCGARVTTATWGATSAFAFSSGAKASNPYNTGKASFYATLASYTGGAVAGDVTVVRYAATISSTTPAGIYTNYFTYVITPTF